MFQYTEFHFTEKGGLLRHKKLLFPRPRFQIIVISQRCQYILSSNLFSERNNEVSSLKQCRIPVLKPGLIESQV